jgi:uncharacterized protein (DUF1778 family)
VTAKTSQLQIRVTADQKRALKRRAAAVGQSVSSYVLGCALPARGAEVDRRVRALLGGHDRDRALAALRQVLRTLDPDELADAVTSLDPTDTPPVPLNYLAATVEQVCHERGTPPPSWTRTVAPLGRPHFSRDLRSLWPTQMRRSTVPYKRRNLFIDLTDEPAAVGDRDPTPGPPAVTRAAAGPWAGSLTSDVPASLVALNAELGRRRILAELCAAHGALFLLSYSAHPTTRHIKALFQPLASLKEAISTVASERGLEPQWVVGVARDVLDSNPLADPYIELEYLRVYAGRPDYLLAATVASLRMGEGADVGDDIRFLMRGLGLVTTVDALAVVHRSVGTRQLPVDVTDSLRAIVER